LVPRRRRRAFFLLLRLRPVFVFALAARAAGKVALKRIVVASLASLIRMPGKMGASGEAVVSQA
jgi:hypothetical protein